MILIYTHKTSTRLNYILNFIFNDIQGVGFEVVTDKQEFIASNQPKINYSSEEIENSFQYSNADAEKYAKFLVNTCMDQYKIELELMVTK